MTPKNKANKKTTTSGPLFDRNKKRSRAEIIGYLNEAAKTLRLDIVKMVGIGKKGHLGGSLSIADVVTALYFYKMKHDPKNPKWEKRDRFLLSKGHSALAQYAALAECGYFPKEELNKVKELGGMLQGHPDLTKTPGIEANTGSLGQGISMACGIAAGLKIDGNLESKVYCVLGCGELAEGQVWEAAMAASVFKLNKLIAILDFNNVQATGPRKEIFDTDPIPEKWQAFGWNVFHVDGHDMAQIIDCLDTIGSKNGKPSIIIAKTVKGKGISFAEHNAAFHNGMLTAEQYEQAIKEISG